MGTHVLPALPSNPDDSDRPWWLRMLRHSSELTMAGYSATIGAISFMLAGDPENFTAGPFLQLPSLLAYVITAIICVGGLCALTGIVMRIRNLKVELITEQVGWFLMFIGWGVYVLAAFGYSEVTATTAALCWVVVGSAARVAALVLRQFILTKKQNTEKQVQELFERIEGPDNG